MEQKGAGMQSKQQLLRDLREEFSRWEELLGSLSADRIVRRDLPAGLSVKDVMAHLMAWQGLSIARLEAARDNRDPTYSLGPDGLDPDADENVEQINAWIHEKYLDAPWEQVYRGWSAGFMHALELAEGMPEESLMQPARYPWLRDAPLAAVVVGLYEHHHEEHYGALVTALRGKESQ